MTEPKLKKIIVSATVGAVILMFFLCSFLIYQLISIKNERNRSDELTNAIIEYNKLIEDGEDTLETRSMRWWIERRAREIGYVYKDDIKLK